MQVHNLRHVATHTRPCASGKTRARSLASRITHYDESWLPGASSGSLTRANHDFVSSTYCRLAEREAEARLLPMRRRRGTAVIVNRRWR